MIQIKIPVCVCVCVCVWLSPGVNYTIVIVSYIMVLLAPGCGKTENKNLVLLFLQFWSFDTSIVIIWSFNCVWSFNLLWMVHFSVQFQQCDPLIQILIIHENRITLQFWNKRCSIHYHHYHYYCYYYYMVFYLPFVSKECIISIAS